MMQKIFLGIVTTLFGVFCSFGVGACQVEIPLHYAIAIEGDKVYVDYGEKDEIAVGTRLSVFRENLQLTHPITGKKLVGRIFLGEIKVRFVGDQFSVALADSSLKKDIRVGDIVLREGSAYPRSEKKLGPIGREISEGVAPKVIVSKSSSLGASMGYFVYGKNDSYLKVDADYWHRFFSSILSIKTGLGGVRGEAKRVKSEVPIFDRSGIFIGYRDSVKVDKAAFYYGYGEGELSTINGNLALIAGLMLGLSGEGPGGGVMGRIRIGGPKDTHLEIGGFTASAIGSRGFVQLNVKLNEKLSLTSETLIEDLPLGEDSGIRISLGSDIAFGESTRWKFLVGYGGRTVNRGGINIGSGMAFNF